MITIIAFPIRTTRIAHRCDVHGHNISESNRRQQIRLQIVSTHPERAENAPLALQTREEMLHDRPRLPNACVVRLGAVRLRLHAQISHVASRRCVKIAEQHVSERTVVENAIAWRQIPC